MKCDCCEYDDPEINDEYDICGKCWWEQDVLAAENPDENVGGPNHCTLNEAKANFKKFGACDAHGLWCKTGKYPNGSTS